MAKGLYEAGIDGMDTFGMSGIPGIVGISGMPGIVGIDGMSGTGGMTSPKASNMPLDKE